MHRGFLDKGRRHINLREMQVENVLPEHFGQFYPSLYRFLLGIMNGRIKTIRMNCYTICFPQGTLMKPI